MSAIVIIGLGVTGLACCRYFLKQHVVPVVLDTRNQPPLLAQLPDSVPFYGGAIDFTHLERAAQIIISPGVPLHEPAVQRALQQKLPILSDIDLFITQVKQPVIGITGSNGKSTVVTLLERMAQAADMSMGVGGNLGIPALDLINPEHEAYILELSSFQLERSQPLPLEVAVFLNFSPDHLDSHKSFDDYWDAKQRIFLNANHKICNRDDVKTTPVEAQSTRTFGLDNLDYGRTEYDGQLWLSKDNRAFIPIEELALLGEHNQYNALAAMAIADYLNIPQEIQRDILRNFSGIPHRCQVICQQHGVTWINDSKATNIGATQAALQGLGNKAVRNIVLIAGGQAKGQNLRLLSSVLANYVRITVCFGEDAGLFSELPQPSHRVQSLSEAVHCAARYAQFGDIVLLSPACASFDMFRSYQERGEIFTQLVKSLS